MPTLLVDFIFFSPFWQCKEEYHAWRLGHKCCTGLRHYIEQLLKQNIKVSAPFENSSGKNHSSHSASLGAGTRNHFNVFGNSTTTSKTGGAVENHGRAPNHSVISFSPAGSNAHADQEGQLTENN